MFNYDSSQVGVPYVRANGINIQYPISGIPFVTVAQERAVKLSDGTIASLGDAGSISFEVNLKDNTLIPLVDPTTGAHLGQNVLSVQVMLSILAIIRQQQLLQNL